MCKCMSQRRIGGLSLCIQGTPWSIKMNTVFLRFIPVYTGNTLIITYCLLNKIGACKILPAFCCFFRHFVSRRILNLIWSLSNSYLYLKRFFNGAHFYNFSAHRPILLTTSNLIFWCLILTNYSILILPLRLCFIRLMPNVITINCPGKRCKNNRKSS